MAIYKFPPKQEVYDLINQANPGLSKPLTATNCVLANPTVIANAVYPASNSSIVVTPAPGNNDYIGKQTLKYNRRDLSKMFRGVTVLVKKYATRNPTAANQLAFTIYELLPDINRLYGLNLTEDDVNTGNILRGSTLEGGQYTTTVTVTTKATSLGYIGSFSLKWMNTPQSLVDMITSLDLDGRKYPGGNLFDETHLPILSGEAYRLDFTQTFINAGYTPPVLAKQNWSWNTTWINVMAACCTAINTASGGRTNLRGYVAGENYKTHPGSLMGMQFQVLSLPSAEFPELNSRFYNRCLIVFVPDDCPWAVGHVIHHYNA